MSVKQLETLYKFESEKERNTAQKMQIAENEYQDNLLRLQSVAEYRLEYMKRLEQRSRQGFNSATYRHFHAFINKLDNAAEQVKIAITQSKAMMEKCKKEWLMQRQKVQAVEHLIDKKLKIIQKKADKQEQNMFDELATQQFIRSHR